MDDAEPIATYHERLLRVQRRFELHADRIVVHAKWALGRQFTMTIPLAELKPQTTDFWIRQRVMKKAIVVTALSAAAAVVFNRPGYEAVQPWLIYILYGMAIVGGAVVVLSWPKVQFARFLSRQDKKPGLDIARAGPDESRFLEFVEQIKKQIRKQ